MTSMPRAIRPAALAAALLCLAPAAVTAPPAFAVVERFATDPLAPGHALPFYAEGDVADRFTFLPEEPPRFPGDRRGTLRVLYDTTLPAARIFTPLGGVASLDQDFAFGAILTIRSEGFEADPNGFSQIAFGLWNGHTTGIDRTGFHGVDLVAHSHRAALGSDSGPDAPADDQRGDDRAGLADQRYDNDGGQHRLGAESDQTVMRFERQHHADSGSCERH